MVGEPTDVVTDDPLLHPQPASTGLALTRVAIIKDATKATTIHSGLNLVNFLLITLRSLPKLIRYLA